MKGTVPECDAEFSVLSRDNDLTFGLDAIEDLPWPEPDIRGYSLLHEPNDKPYSGDTLSSPL